MDVVSEVFVIAAVVVAFMADAVLNPFAQKDVVLVLIFKSLY